MTKRKRLAWNLFRHLDIGHSEIDSSFEFGHSNLWKVSLRGDHYAGNPSW